MKILVECEHGNVRSVAMAYVIKTIYQHKHEVIAIGVRDISYETWEMLVHWADKCVVVDSKIPKLAYKYKPLPTAKAIYLSIGEDIWHNPKDQELIHLCLKELHKLNL